MTDQARLQALLSHLESQQRNDPDTRLVRRAVRLRANDMCEYCLRRTVNPFHVDHIIPADLWQRYIAGRIAGISPAIRRRGPDHLDNLAWSCPLCNGSKLQRVTARVSGRSQRIFDPRHDSWPEHFVFASHHLAIIGVTLVGVATEKVLNFNGGGLDGPLVTRHDDIVSGRYPPTVTRWGTTSVAFVDAYLTELAQRDSLSVCTVNARDFPGIANSYATAAL